MKTILIILSISIFPKLLIGQFSKSTSIGFSNIIKVNDDGEIFHGTIDGNYNYIITKFNLNGDQIWSKKILPFEENTNERRVNIYRNGNHLEDSNLLIPSLYRPVDAKFGLSLLNSDGDFIFSTVIDAPDFYSPYYDGANFIKPSVIKLNENEMLLLNTYKAPLDTAKYYSFLKFTNEGKLIEHKEFQDMAVNDPIIYLNKLEDNRFVLIRNGSYTFDETHAFEGCRLQFLNENLEAQKTLQIHGNIQRVCFKDGRYYILARRYRNVANDNFSARTSIICLDNNFEVLWAKEYEDIAGLVDFSKTSYGFLIFQEYNDIGFDIVAIDLNGEVIQSKKIYTNYLINRISTSNAYIVSASRFLSSQNDSVHVNCYANTLDDFECYVGNTCITAEDFEAKIEIVDDFFLNPVIIDITVTDVAIQTEDYIPDYEDYCNKDFGSFPVPLFELPDTICVNSPQDILELNNRNADAVDWQMAGSQVERSQAFIPAPLMYTEAGEYTVTQKVTFEGCTNEYSTNIVVVEPIDLETPTEIILCDDEPYLIDASDEEVVSYLWEDNSTASTLLTNNQGRYKLEVSDKYCTQSIDFDIEYFDYNLIDPLLGNDTVICVQKPLSLGVEIDPAAEFLWSDGSTQYPRTITEAGNYDVTTSLFGCDMESSIFIEVEDCSTQIYIPTAFSPNRDGINDTFYPLGNSFELLDFAIFDRWGGLVHHQLDPWDGSFRGQAASLGVYTYRLSLRNVRLDEVEEYSGGFVLVR